MVSLASRRTRPISESDSESDTPPLNNAKRARTNADTQEAPGAVEEQKTEGHNSLLKRQCLPAKIRALPHVVKLIDMLLMTPDEAITEAARIGQSEWVLHLSGYYCCDTTDAFYHAATRGDRIITQMLIDQFLDDVDVQVIRRTAKAMKKAALTAANIGHLQVVELLFSEIYYYHRRSRSSVFKDARDILDAAAASGQRDIVKFMINHAEQNGYIERYRFYPPFDTLSHAIVGGDAEVINFLISHPRLRWNLKGAFKATIKRGDKALAEGIYDIYPQQSRGKNLFGELAANGYLEAVKYLYNNGHDDEEAVGRAFKRAAGGYKKGTAVVEILLGTGRVTPSAIDKVFQQACARQENMDIMTLLYNTKRVSQQGINRAFSTVNSTAAMKLLYENERISEGSLIGAFKKSTNRHLGKTLEILRFLSKENCIPSQLISKAFVAAVEKQHTEIVQSLCADDRIADETMREAFVIAATNGYADLVKLIYNSRRISPDILLKAFTLAVHRGHLEATKQIMARLSEQQIPREFKHKAFVTAAKHGRMQVMEIVCENESKKWPLEVLKEAIDGAEGNSQMVKLIHKIVCDQVFNESSTERIETIPSK